MTCILVISPEPWSGHAVSKHHYALELVRRGHRVLFLGPPSLEGLRTQIEDVVIAGEGYVGSLQTVHTPRVAPGLRFAPSPVRRALEARWLTRLEHQIGSGIDVIWLFENSRFYDMRFAGDRLKIYQQVDLNQDFQPIKAASSADLTIAISQPIADRIAPFSRQFLRLTHGSQSTTPTARDPRFAQHFPPSGIHAMMVGNLDIPYLDIELVSALVREDLAVTFHFVGQCSPDSALHHAIAKEPNVLFWGKLPSQEIPGLLPCSDILLVAYNAQQHLEQLANPHKIMQYLAAGPVVLATKTLEYDDRPDLVVTAENHEAYLAAFREIVSNLSLWNAPHRVEVRQQFAFSNAYRHQVDRIAEALPERGHLITSGDNL